MAVTVLKRLSPLLFGLLFIATIPIVSYLVDTDLGKTVILRARSRGILTNVQLDLRDDGSFRLTKSEPLGGNIYRGNYKFANDTLHIDKSDQNLYPTLTFIIKSDTVSKRQYLDPIPSDISHQPRDKLYITNISK